MMGRMLTPAEFGELQSLISLVAITGVFGIIAQTVVTKYVSKFVAQKKEGKIADYYSDSLIMTIKIGIVVFVIFSLLTPIFAQYLKISSYFVFILLFSYLIVGFSVPVGNAVLIGMQNFAYFGISQLVWSLTKLVSGVMLVYLSYGVFGAVAGFTIGNVVTFVVLFYLLRNYFKKSVEKQDYTELMSYGSFALPLLLFSSILMNADMIFAKHFLSELDAGIYASLSVLGRIVLYSASGLGMVVFPKISHAKENNKSPLMIIFKGIALSLFVNGLVVAFYYFYGGQILPLIFGESYIKAVPYLAYYGLAMAFVALQVMLVQAALSYEVSSAKYALGGAVLIEIVLFQVYNANLMEIVSAFGIGSFCSVLLIALSLRHGIKQSLQNFSLEARNDL